MIPWTDQKLNLLLKYTFYYKNIKYKIIFNLLIKYVLKKVSFGSKDCTKELKLECAYFLGLGLYKRKKTSIIWQK